MGQPRFGMALTAVVTGASGYLAGEVIHQLLAKGYNVRGTVTNVEDRRKTGPLVALRKALPGKLTLTEADLFTPGSFDDVVKGADFVFHTASNVIFDSSNPEVSLLLPWQCICLSYFDVLVSYSDPYCFCKDTLLRPFSASLWAFKDAGARDVSDRLIRLFPSMLSMML